MQELVRDLDTRVIMTGVPPYAPDDFIGYAPMNSGPDSRIELYYAKHFRVPLSFTPQEALALRFALESFAGSSSPETADAVRELGLVLEDSLEGRAREAMARGRAFVTPRRTKRMRELLATLEKAALKRKVVDLEYYSSHRGKLTSRRVQVFELVEIGTHFYAWCWCELAQDTRHFRVDRVKSARLTTDDAAQSPPRRRNAGRMETLFSGQPRQTLVLRYGAALAREIEDEWRGSEARLRRLSDGGLELTTPLYNAFWAIGHCLAKGAGAEIVEPVWLREQHQATLAATLASHE
jgi:proteasome accessory factor C